MSADTWIRRASPSIEALSEATFPPNDIGAPDWRSTEMLRRTLEYLEDLPPPQRRLLLLLFFFVEFLAPLLVLRIGRFSRLNRATRTEAIRGWRRSRYLPLRILGDAIKATTTMMYMSHPSVIAYIGEYRVCDWPSDPVRIAVHEDALQRMQEPSA
ncbi:MAG: hypothetical protein R3B13_08580 [Polyangiaceae bacterium]